MQAGSRLGPYEILARIGAGGMGEVWRARDTRLGREVAIKILPAQLAADAKLKIRFEREARTISHIAHPNICSLFDVGENYIVMELLEGESLAARLARGPLSLPEVVRCGVQVAEALGQAHRQGVVHRDVKPGNVMITKSGAKLLDFGLAKSTRVEIESHDETVQKPITEQGAVLGTFQYMAPEQIAGEEPDARSDIFALGAVLYEMATGKRAFEGKNRTSLIGAIVSGEPRAIRELQPLTPPALEHVILKCLEKDPDDRWQNASDIAEELRWISQAGSQAGVAPLVVKRRRLREWLMMGAVAASLAAAGAMAWLWRTAPAEQMFESSIEMGATGGLGHWSGPPAFSPDGKTLAFAADDKDGRRMLWLRPLAGETPQTLANTEGASSPFWSPDGKSIAFLAAGKLKTIPAGGGASDVIADANIQGGGTWNRDGVFLYSGGFRAPLFSITQGGEPAAVLAPQAIGARVVSWPWFLPDGNHFLVLAGSAATPSQKHKGGIWIATLDGKERARFLTASDSHAVYVEPGWLLFARGGLLRAQQFDPKTLQLSGDPTPIAPVQWNPVSRFMTVAASGTGILVYQKPGSIQLSELQLRHRSGEVLRTLGRGDIWVPSLSNDGRHVAVERGDETSPGAIWILDLDSGSQARMTFDPRNEGAPVWSPDNQTIAYYGPAVGILTKSIGGVPETLLDEAGVLEVPTDWSGDGRFIAFYRFNPGDVLVVNVATRELIEVATTPAFESAAMFSPDSKWIAYQSDEGGRTAVYVQPFPPTGAKHQISTPGGRTPRWPIPNEIVYIDENGLFTTVRVDTTNGFSVGASQTHPLLVDDRGNPSHANYDVAADGTVLVNTLIRDNPASLTLVTNWTLRTDTASKE